MTTNSSSSTLSRTFSVSPGTYRVKASYFAFNGSNYENIIDYSAQVKY